MSKLKANHTLQNGKYTIIACLGQGGFGITYLAEQSNLGRNVAIKEFFLKEYCNRDEETSHVTVPSEGSREMFFRFKEKFLKEARTIATLNHPNIIKIFDIFEENNTAYFVMEYIGNGCLYEITKVRALPEVRTLRYAMQIANALEYLHKKNILHLDIKPSNILFNKKDEAVLIDFGISKKYDEEGDETSSTPVGISRGYAPLEQYNNGVRTFSPETDIYALGATIYRMLTGKTPPESSVVNEEGLPSSISNVSKEAWRCVVNCMQPIRKNRPKNMADVKIMMRKWNDSLPSKYRIKDNADMLRGEAPNDISLKRKSNCTFLSLRTTDQYKKDVKERYVIGMIANVILGLIFWSIMEKGGFYNEEWDYYDLSSYEPMLIVTCFGSAIAELLIIKGKSKMFYILILSNLLYWYYFAKFFSYDGKTGISYIDIAIYPAAIGWLICSIANLMIDRYGRNITK